MLRVVVIVIMDVCVCELLYDTSCGQELTMGDARKKPHLYAARLCRPTNLVVPTLVVRRRWFMVPEIIRHQERE